MRTILIIVGDNDFYWTFIPLLKTLQRAIEYHRNLTQDNIKRIIMEGIRFHYIAFQYRYDLDCYKGSHSVENIDDTVDYLKDIKILFDEEAEKDILKGDRNSEAYYLDLQTGKVEAY